MTKIILKEWKTESKSGEVRKYCATCKHATLNNKVAPCSNCKWLHNWEPRE